MLKLSPIELFFRAIPEGFLFILAIYSFSRIKINKKDMYYQVFYILY